MIIKCQNCKKSFNLDLSLIPENGRSLQCGSCNHRWFFKPNSDTPLKLQKEEVIIENNELKKFSKNNVKTKNDAHNKIEETTSEKSLKSNSKSSISLTIKGFLSLLIVVIISFAALIIVIDTFKIYFEKIYPGTELALYNLFETMNDIYLFFMNLIN